MKVLITGAAGFIGSRTAEVLAESGMEVLGVDNLNDYYDPQLKVARLRRGGFHISAPCPENMHSADENNNCGDGAALPPEGAILESTTIPGLSFIRMDIKDARFEQVAMNFAPDAILHLAAQPGVRYSLSHPEESLDLNIMTFARILELCRSVGVRRLLYASSSSVYGEQSPHAFRETDVVDSPASVYAVSKRANEMLAKVYSDTYGMHMTGMRFFSVYGEWGRPDMAPYLFTDAILKNETVTLYNGGRSSRDFTYIEDVVKCIHILVEDSVEIFRTSKNHEIVNIGHGSPTLMRDFVRLLEKLTGRKANLRMLPMQPGDVLTTLADTSKFQIRYGYAPRTSLKEGMTRFVKWFNEFRGQNREEKTGKEFKVKMRPA